MVISERVSENIIINDNWIFIGSKLTLYRVEISGNGQKRFIPAILMSVANGIMNLAYKMAVPIGVVRRAVYVAEVLKGKCKSIQLQT